MDLKEIDVDMINWMELVQDKDYLTALIQN